MNSLYILQDALFERFKSSTTWCELDVKHGITVPSLRISFNKAVKMVEDQLLQAITPLMRRSKSLVYKQLSTSIESKTLL